MSRISVNNTDRVMEAILWCTKHFKKGDWTVETQWPGSGYIFSFNQEHDASWFGLKWAD